jgi:hypothetical protein
MHQAIFEASSASMSARIRLSILATARAAVIAAAAALSVASPAAGHGLGGGGHHGGAGLAQQQTLLGVPRGSTGAAGAGDSAILHIESEAVEARDRTLELAVWVVLMVAIQTIVFAVALFTALRAAKSAREAAKALPMLERAYVFLDQDLSLTHGDHRGPHGGLKVSFQFGLKNHGRTPAVIRWINIRHQYLAEPPEGIYDEAGAGEGRILGAGASLRFDHHDTIIPGADWDKAEAGDGGVYLHGRVVYWDVFKGQHETYFCWRYDHAREAFSIADSANLNRFD